MVLVFGCRFSAVRQILTDPSAPPFTVRNLADRLGFSTGVIYRYFESLDAIAEAVIRERAELTEQGLADLLARIEPDTVIDVGLFDPVVDRRLRDAEVLRELRELGVAAASNAHHVIA